MTPEDRGARPDAVVVAASIGALVDELAAMLESRGGFTNLAGTTTFSNYLRPQ